MALLRRFDLATVIIVLFCVSVVAQAGVMVYYTHSLVEGRAIDQGTATASFCINHPPAINITCNETMLQNSQYQCTVNGSDIDDLNLTYFSVFITNNTIFVITPDGVINVTPGPFDTGNHSVMIFVNDTKGCSNSIANATFNFSVVNINDPPYLATPVPDATFLGGTALQPYFLNDYFDDPDNDPLTYTSVSPSELTVTISGSGVTYRHDRCVGDPLTYPVVFTAEDPYGLTAESNTVTVTVLCSASSQQGGSSGSSGGGGGGGGGFVLPECQPEWECFPWMACLPNGTRWRRCVDMAGCEEERYLKGACEYVVPGACEENWSCGAWGPCRPDGVQRRVCTDLNSCGSNESLPFLERSCEYIPTCSDGIRNGGELGIDCGGPCARVCVATEFPMLQPSPSVLTRMLLILIGILLVLVTLYGLFRRQIHHVLAVLGWWLAGKRNKTILLSNEHKDELLARLRELERSLPASTDALLEHARRYFTFAFGLDIEFVPDEAEQAIRAHRMGEALREALLSFVRSIVRLERLERVVRMRGEQLAEELRGLVVATSHATRDDVRREVQEREPAHDATPIEQIRIAIMNAQVALQFEQVAAAKKHYLSLLDLYHRQPEAAREAVYDEVRRAYHLIKYVSTYTRPGR